MNPIPVTIVIPDITLAQFLRMKLEEVTTKGTREGVALIQIAQALEQGINAAQQTQAAPEAPAPEQEEASE